MYTCMHICMWIHIHTHTDTYICFNVERDGWGWWGGRQKNWSQNNRPRPDQTLSEMKVRGGKQDHGNVEDEGASPAGLKEPVS